MPFHPMRVSPIVRRLPALVLLLAVASGCGSTQPDKLRISDFGWLAGSWVGTGPEQMTVEEQWSAPHNGLMSGLHIERMGDDVRVRGEMRLVGGENGVVLLGSPEGEPPSNYPLAEFRPGIATFANPRASAPQLCRFERSGDRLSVRFESTDRLGSTRKVDYQLELTGPPPKRDGD